MQRGQNVVLFLLHEDPLGLVLVHVHVLGVEPGLEHAQVVEDLGHQEVKQGPQLGKVVLQGRA